MEQEQADLNDQYDFVIRDLEDQLGDARSRLAEHENDLSDGQKTRDTMQVRRFDSEMFAAADK